MISYSKFGLRLTNEQFDDKIIHLGFLRIDDYINSKTSIRFECKVCGKLYKKPPKTINKLKCGCLLKHKLYVDIIRSKNILPIDNYRNTRYKINHKCLICDDIFITTPKSILNSKFGCVSCSGKRFSTKKYKKMLPKSIELIGDYKGSNFKHDHKCLKCHMMWNTKPNYILHMSCGCPNCSFSKGELMIKNILDDFNISYISQLCVKINSINYRFDFYLVDYGTYIEYDGIQHFKPVEYFGGNDYYLKVKNNDFIKNNWISSNNYKLLRISYLDNIKDKLIEFIF